MSCAGVTAYSAIKRANLKPGDVGLLCCGCVRQSAECQVIGFSGIGALGILAVQMAKAMVGLYPFRIT